MLVLDVDVDAAASSAGDSDSERLREATMKEVEDVLRARLASVGRVLVARHGPHQLTVRLPRGADPEAISRLLSRSGAFELSIVDDEATAKLRELALPEGVRLETERFADRQAFFLAGSDADALLAAHRSAVPPARVVRLGDSQPRAGDRELRTYLVHAEPGLTGSAIDEADVEMTGGMPDVQVALRFDADGAKALERITAGNVGRRLAILLDGRVSSAPVIQEKISSGVAYVALGAPGPIEEELADAKALAAVLRSGALPVSVTVAAIDANPPPPTAPSTGR
jgi:preprotein translocase subunit SecD